MARVPEAKVERVKRQVSLVRLAEVSEWKLKRTGKDRFGRCAFHADDTARPGGDTGRYVQSD